MGMDATFKVWVGVRFRDWDDRKTFLDKLPKTLFRHYAEDGEDCELKWGNDLKALTGGVEVEMLWCWEECCGFGVRAFYHEWGKAEPFNLTEISKAVAEATVQMHRLFKEWGIDDEIGVWCQTDYC